MTTPQEWWEDPKFKLKCNGHQKVESSAYNLPLIIQEAERRERARWHDIIRHICQTVHQAYPDQGHTREPADCRHGVCSSLSLLT